MMIFIMAATYTVHVLCIKGKGRKRCQSEFTYQLNNNTCYDFHDILYRIDASQPMYVYELIHLHLSLKG